MSNPYDINWSALSVFPKELGVCGECGHNYMTRAKRTSVDRKEVLVAETACPMCESVELEIN